MDIREKLVELLTEFYGCDPMYYDVDALIVRKMRRMKAVRFTKRDVIAGHKTSWSGSSSH